MTERRHIAKMRNMPRLRLSLYSIAAVAALFSAAPSLAVTSTAGTAPLKIESSGSSSSAPQDLVPIDTEKLQSEENGGRNIEGTYERAIVTGVRTTAKQIPSGAEQLKAYDVEFLSGPLKGKLRTLTSDVSTNPYGLEPRKGDKVVVYLQPDPAGGEPLAYLESFDRRAAIYWLIALFVLTLVLLAGWQGFKIAFSILLCVLLIGLILIPSFLKGLNPVPVAMLLTVVFTAITCGFTTGWNRKSFVTVIGTLGGVIVAYLISVIFANWAHLSGLSTEEDRMFFDKNPLLHPQGLLFAGIVIAAMGVVEDVAVSIASGVMEVRKANPQLGFKNLFRSGMTVGRDHMGALANTLIFAYVGGSLSTLLLFTQYGSSWAKFINFDSVVDEIVRSLAGTIGLVFTVPITALLAAWMAGRREKSSK